MDFHYGIICLVLVCTHLNFASGLMCYECNSKTPGQEDCVFIPEGSTKYLVNCTEPKNKSCRVQELWIDFILTESKDKNVNRQCSAASFDLDKPCYYRTGYSGRLGICNCLEDGCNGHSRTAPYCWTTLAIAVLLVTYLFK